MNVNLYKLQSVPGTPLLTDILTYINLLPLTDRLKRVGNFDIRLEHIAPPRSADNTSDFWLLDFIKLRFEQGPGKVGRSTPIEGFNLADDQGFGEEAAAIFDPATQYIAVQYNHHGVRATSMQDYFNQFLSGGANVIAYSFAIKLDERSDVRLAQKNFITKVKFKIAPSKIIAGHRNADIGLSTILDFNSQQNGGNIELTIKAAKGENLRNGPVMSLIRALKLIRTDDVEEDITALTQFEVVGRNDILGRADSINMLAPKLQVVIDQLSLGGDRRYTILSRWIGLQRAMRGWHEITNR